MTVKPEDLKTGDLLVVKCNEVVKFVLLTLHKTKNGILMNNTVGIYEIDFDDSWTDFRNIHGKMVTYSVLKRNKSS